MRSFAFGGGARDTYEDVKHFLELCNFLPTQLGSLRWLANTALWAMAQKVKLTMMVYFYRVFAVLRGASLCSGQGSSPVRPARDQVARG